MRHEKSCKERQWKQHEKAVHLDAVLASKQGALLEVSNQLQQVENAIAERERQLKDERKKLQKSTAELRRVEKRHQKRRERLRNRGSTTFHVMIE